MPHLGQWKSAASATYVYVPPPVVDWASGHHDNHRQEMRLSRVQPPFGVLFVMSLLKGHRNWVLMKGFTWRQVRATDERTGPIRGDLLI